MDDISEAEKQKRRKYEHHDFSLEDLQPRELELLKGIAHHNFVHTRETSVSKLIIESFMGYLKNAGYRIIKCNWKRELDENQNPVNALYDQYGTLIRKEKP